MISRFSLQEPEPSDRSPSPVTTGVPRMGEIAGDPARPAAGSFVPWPTQANGAPATFRDVFCRRFAVVSERYEVEMLQRCLTRRARLAGPLIRLFARHFFSVDQLFVQSIGRARTADDLKTELKAFREHPDNRLWSRRVLKLRLSVWRIWDTADEVLPHLVQRPDDRAWASRVPWN